MSMGSMSPMSVDAGAWRPDSASGEMSLRELVDMTIQAADGGDPNATAAVWREMKHAKQSGTPVTGSILMTVEAGAFLHLGDGLYGFAPREELPVWVPRRPRRSAVGREIEGVVSGIDEEAGVVYVSPRLLALKRARGCLGISRRVSGRIVTADLDGIEVDIGGARGFAPRRELELDWLLEEPERGIRWRGYVIEMSETALVLSRFGQEARRERAERREAELAELEVGGVATGRVLAVDERGALVAFGDGLVCGAVPRPGIASPAGRRLRAGEEAAFKVVDRRRTSRDADVVLWPAPAGG
jgi:ribosomal protein S1